MVGHMEVMNRQDPSLSLLQPTVLGKRWRRAVAIQQLRIDALAESICQGPHSIVRPVQVAGSARLNRAVVGAQRGGWALRVRG